MTIFRLLLSARGRSVLAARAVFNVRTRFGRRPYGPLTERERAACRHEVSLAVRARHSYMIEGERGEDGRLRFDPSAPLHHWIEVSAACPRCAMPFEFTGAPARNLSTTPLSVPTCLPGRLDIRLPVCPVVPPRQH